jgi:hypothetical protein
MAAFFSLFLGPASNTKRRKVRVPLRRPRRMQAEINLGVAVAPRARGKKIKKNARQDGGLAFPCGGVV